MEQRVRNHYVNCINDNFRYTTKLNETRERQEIDRVHDLYNRPMPRHFVPRMRVPEMQFDVLIPLHSHPIGLMESTDLLEQLFSEFAHHEHTDVTLPLTSDALDKLEEKTFSEYPNENKYDECVICKDKFEADTKIKILPCKHIFHVNCISEWLKNYYHKCPVCRQPCGEHTANV